MFFKYTKKVAPLTQEQAAEFLKDSSLEYSNPAHGVVTTSDIAIAKAIGWKNITKTDHGTVIGTHPITKKTDFIPTPSSNWNDIMQVINCLNEAGYLTLIEQYYHTHNTIKWEVMLCKGDMEYYELGTDLYAVFSGAVSKLIKDYTILDTGAKPVLKTVDEEPTGVEAPVTEKQYDCFITVADSQILVTAVRRIGHIRATNMVYSNKCMYMFDVVIADCATPIVFKFDTLEEAVATKSYMLDQVQAYFNNSSPTHTKPVA